MTDPDRDTPHDVYQRLDRTAMYPYPTREYVRRALWELTYKILFRFTPKKYGGWRRRMLRWFGATIPDTSKFKRTARVMHPWLLSMGEHSIIGEGVNVYNLGPISIGSHTVISQYVHLCAGTHDYHQSNLPLMRSTIRIGSGVWICADAFIGPDVTIGDNVIVGARAVVTRDVPPGVIVAGNPAKIVRERPRPDDLPAPEEINAASTPPAEASASRPASA